MPGIRSEARFDLGKEIGQPSRPDDGLREVSDPSARAAQRLTVLGEMTGGIAHDFRNILAVIDSGLRLAERNAGKPEIVHDIVAEMREAVARGSRLTSQLLNFAQQRELQTSAADVNALLAMLEVFLKYGAGPSARIVLDLSPRIPKCLVDPSQFAAAILNLVINARDAMPHGGAIQIGTARYEPAEPIRGPGDPHVYVRVRVQDNGLGMSGPVAQKIFEPFFTTKGEKGTGLGVPQVCAFMRNVGGRVSVASELGRGTTFDLLFPAIEDQADRARADAADRFTGAGAGERALGNADGMTKDFNDPSGQAVSIAAA